MKHEKGIGRDSLVTDHFSGTDRAVGLLFVCHRAVTVERNELQSR